MHRSARRRDLIPTLVTIETERNLHVGNLLQLALFLCALMALIPAMFLLVVFEDTRLNLAAPVAFVVLLCATLLWCGHLIRRGLARRARYAAVRYARSGEELGKFLRGLRALTCDYSLRVLARELGTRCPGVVVRAGARAGMRRVEPIRVPFEPIPLDEAESELVAEAQQPIGRMRANTGLRRACRAEQGLLGRLQLWRRRIHARDLLGTLPLLFYILFLMRLSPTPWLHAGYMAAGALLAVAIGVLLALLLPLARTREWLVVPGGLVLRRLNPLRRNVSLDVFTRRATALVLARLRREFWRAFLTDGTRRREIMLSDAEAHFLLRAWLSPVPPPSEGMLDDLR